MTNIRKYADAIERVAWTTAEAAGAGGIIAGYQALPLADIPDGWVPLTLVVLTVVIAGIKNAIATQVGNGSASTLPITLEPIPAEAVQHELPDGVGMPLQHQPERAMDADGDGQPDYSDDEETSR